MDWIKPTLHGGTMNLADVAISAGVVLFALAVIVNEIRGRCERHAAGRTPSPPAETLS